mgnify:FL=1
MIYLLDLIKTFNNSNEIEWLIQETTELRNILSAIITKVE